MMLINREGGHKSHTSLENFSIIMPSFIFLDNALV